LSSSSLNLIEIGKISRLHGYGGAVVVFTSSGKESVLGDVDAVWIGTSPDKASSYLIHSASWMPKGWKIELSNVDSEEAAKALVGMRVFAERESLPSLEENEFYVSDLLDLPAYDRDTDELIGRFIALEESSSERSIKASCWLFETKDGPLSVPAVAHFIHSVDLKQKKIWLHNLQDLP
jgi:16S rRNA processing protein RimM